MRRRATRGGRDTPPLHSDDSDREEGSGSRGNDSTSQHPPDLENGAPRDNDRSENESSPEQSSGSGLADQIHNANTVVVGGTNGGDIINNADVAGKAGRYSNTAFDRLTMDAYGSSDEDS